MTVEIPMPFQQVVKTAVASGQFQSEEQACVGEGFTTAFRSETANAEEFLIVKFKSAQTNLNGVSTLILTTNHFDEFFDGRLKSEKHT